MHPKMNYTYVGIDNHSKTHTAVVLNCFFEKIGVIRFDNNIAKFPAFLEAVTKLKLDGTTLMFGLEDVSLYGWILLTFLKNNHQQVKHTNPSLVFSERKTRNITRKSDAVDAECAARVLITNFGELPDAIPNDSIWTLRTLVVRRKQIIRGNMGIKSNLHSLLLNHYPNYRDFFGNIDCKSSLEFYSKYPSPNRLKGTTVEELAIFLWETGHFYGEEKAAEIISSIDDTTVQFQEYRDISVQSLIRQLKFNLDELVRLEVSIARAMENINTPLTSMAGIDTTSAAQLLSCIGDIKRFPTSGKLAQYAGVAPITFASGDVDKQYASRCGNRELNSLIYNLAIRVSTTSGCRRKVLNTFFHDYYNRKISEGKTKRQALKCVERRLIHVIWTMLTNNEEYINPPTYNLENSIGG